MMPAASVLRFMTVPLKTAPLLVIIIFSLLLMLAMQASLFGIPLAVVLLTGFCNYSFLLLDSVADNHVEPPVLAVEMMNPVSGQRTLVLLVTIAVFVAAAHGGAVLLGRGFYLPAALVSAMILPALIGVQAVTGSALQALNLYAGLALMRRLGSDYLLTVVFMAACVFAWTIAGALPSIVRLALAMYLWLAAFTLLGGVLRERRDDVGIDDSPTPALLDDTAHAQRARDQFVDRIYAQWRGGAHANALHTISVQVDAANDPLKELRWLYAATRKWPDSRLANKLAQQLLPRLLLARHTGEALDIVRAQLRVDENFRPLAASEALDMAMLARDAGDRATARLLLRDFGLRYPRDPAHAAAHALSRQLER